MQIKFIFSWISYLSMFPLYDMNYLMTQKFYEDRDVKLLHPFLNGLTLYDLLGVLRILWSLRIELWIKVIPYQELLLPKSILN